MLNILSTTKTNQQKGWTSLMHIQQQCLLSFEEIIKYQPKTKLEIILAQLDFTNILNFLSSKSALDGPKGLNSLSLLYSLIAMQLEQIKTIKN